MADRHFRQLFKSGSAVNLPLKFEDSLEVGPRLREVLRDAFQGFRRDSSKAMHFEWWVDKNTLIQVPSVRMNESPRCPPEMNLNTPSGDEPLTELNISVSPLKDESGADHHHYHTCKLTCPLEPGQKCACPQHGDGLYSFFTDSADDSDFEHKMQGFLQSIQHLKALIALRQSTRMKTYRAKYRSSDPSNRPSTEFKMIRVPNDDDRVTSEQFETLSEEPDETGQVWIAEKAD